MPTNTAKPKPPIGDDGLIQSERFMQAARELECDDDPERFKDWVRKLAKTPDTSVNSLQTEKLDSKPDDDGA